LIIYKKRRCIYIYTHVFFDLDGTLTDPWEGITKSLQYGLGKVGITIGDEKELISFIGPPLQDSLRDNYNLGEDDIKTVMFYFRERYSVKGIYENILFDGTEEMLKMLMGQGRGIYLATSKPEQYAREILRHFDIEKYFNGVYGATMDESLVEKVDILNSALTKENINSANAIMVGDRIHDISGAEKVGMNSIFLALGYANEQEAEVLGKMATYTASNMQELCNLFLNI